MKKISSTSFVLTGNLQEEQVKQLQDIFSRGYIPYKSIQLGGDITVHFFKMPFFERLYKIIFNK